MDETRLVGGMSNVFKSGDTVRRGRSSFSPSVERLLVHIRNKCFDRAPEFLGIDSLNRQILSFVPGSCYDDWPPKGDMQWRLGVMHTLGRMLRMYHDVTADFERRDSDVWMLEYKGDLPCEVICHNDIAPYNVTFLDDVPFGFIDFDTCCPAPRVWDVAYALYRFVSLSHTEFDSDTGMYRDYCFDDASKRRALVSEFLASYGWSDATIIPEQVALRLRVLADYIKQRAEAGDAAFQRMLAAGDRDLYLRDTDFVLAHSHEWF